VEDIINYVDKWDYWHNFIVVKTKGVEFDQLLITEERIPLSFEREWIFIGLLDLTPRKTQNITKLYKKLKKNECTLKWEGKIREKPKFTANPAPKLYEMPAETNLADKLNRHVELLELINKIKPSTLEIRLEEISQEDLTSALTMKDYKEAAKKYYESPPRILWNITIRRLSIPRPWSKKVRLRCVETISIISKYLKDFLFDISENKNDIL